MIIADVEVYASYVTVKARDLQYLCNATQKRQHFRTSGVKTLRPYGSLASTANELKNLRLPIGACGLKVQFHFLDPAWKSLSKTAVFRNERMTMDAVITDNYATIPHEVLSKVMDVVDIGIYGTDSAQSVAIPTVWSQLGTVASAANPSGQSSVEPTLPYWAQLKEQVDKVQNEMMNQEDLENALQQAKESGAFNGPQGSQGPKGDQGEQGIPGKDGTDGKDGYTPVKNIDYFDGADGEDGYSPVRGVDYWTDADQQKVVAQAANTAANAIQTSSDIIISTNGDEIGMKDAAQRELKSLILYGKTTQNCTPMPNVPVELESVGKDGSVGVTVCGKNLVDVFHDDINIRREGIANTKHPNTVDINGNITIDIAASDTYGVGFAKALPANAPVTISFDVVSLGNGSSISCVIYDTKDYAKAKAQKRTAVTGKFSLTFTPSTNSVYMFGWYVDNGVSPCGAQISNLQLEFGETASAYEVFVSGGFATAQTPNGLPGISVSSGGNHIDENGQQWICDEIDFARGKYIQRVKTIVLDGAESSLGVESVTVSDISYRRIWHKVSDADLVHRHNVLSNRFFSSADTTYGVARITIDSYLSLYLGEDMQDYDAVQAKSWLAENPVTAQYILAEPVETDLSAEEIAQYSALHTNKTNTTIFNDSGAHMEIKYVADTKTYIDNKFAELASAIINNV